MANETKYYDPKHNAAVYKYKRNNIKRVPLDMKISEYEKLSDAALAAGETVNGYIKTAINQRIERKQAGWIPVSKKLPEENETVMASTKHNVYPEARYTKEYGWECIYEPGADYWVELADVTAWMPSPKAYEPENNGPDGIDRDDNG